MKVSLISSLMEPNLSKTLRGSAGISYLFLDRKSDKVTYKLIMRKFIIQKQFLNLLLNCLINKSIQLPDYESFLNVKKLFASNMELTLREITNSLTNQ